MSKSSKPVATPTLGGLAVTWPATKDSAETQVVYPWTLVGITFGDSTDTAVFLYQDDGSQLERDGKKVTVWLHGRHAARLAMRAQSRAFRRAYQYGTLYFRERYAIDKAGTIIPGLFVLMVPGWFVWKLPRILATVRREWERPGNWGWFTLAVALIAFSFALGAAWAGVRFLNMSRRAVRNATWDPEGISAELSDGGHIRVSWSEFERISWFGPVLLFRGGLRLKFTGLQRRSLIACRVIEESLFPERIERRRQNLDWRSVAIRCAIYWLAASLLVSFATERQDIRNLVMVVFGLGLIWLPLALWIGPYLTARRLRRIEVSWKRLWQPRT